jgi:hypothetical protein
MTRGRVQTTTDRILERGKALVRAIEALETIQPTSPFERGMVWLLLQAYRRRLRGIVEVAPDWMVEEILSASQHLDAGRPAVWLSEN